MTERLVFVSTLGDNNLYPCKNEYGTDYLFSDMEVKIDWGRNTWYELLCCMNSRDFTFCMCVFFFIMKQTQGFSSKFQHLASQFRHWTVVGMHVFWLWRKQALSTIYLLPCFTTTKMLTMHGISNTDAMEIQIKSV